jgi:hypothetical protein
MTFGPASALLEQELAQEIRRQGIVVWLDRDKSTSHHSPPSNRGELISATCFGAAAQSLPNKTTALCGCGLSREAESTTR